MINLALQELKQVSNMRSIKGYKSMSEDELLSALTLPKPARKREKNSEDTKPKINFSKSRIEKIRKKFNKSRHNIFMK